MSLCTDGAMIFLENHSFLEYNKIDTGKTGAQDAEENICSRHV